ncbi:MAG: ABC transporter permease [Devosia sp.]
MNSDLIFGRFDKATVIAFACSILLLALGALVKPDFLSFAYIVQQMQTASFLGIIATGTMIVILMGHIDLSVPWTLTLGAMMATGAQGLLGRYIGPDVALALSIPFGILCGMLVGLVNGIGVAYLRAPSMIFTLGVNAVAQGLMVYHTGGFAPQDKASGLMRWFAVERLIPGVPNPLLIWALVGVIAVFVLTRTALGRRVYAIGNKEKAVYLSGVDAKRVVLICFIIAGGFSATGGILLAGWANRSFQAMGDPYLLPAIAAVVLGGASVMGGKGRYLGTVAGVVLITLLQSILSVIQPQQMLADIGLTIPAESFRQVIFGVVIIGMLLLYGREKAIR